MANIVDDMQGLYSSALGAYQAGKSVGMDEAFRHLLSRLGDISFKHETNGSVDAFRAVEECCRALIAIREDLEERHKLESAQVHLHCSQSPLQ